MNSNAKFALIAGGVLLALIVLALVLQPGLFLVQEETQAEFKDCGMDVDCFGELLNDCSPGKVTIDSPGMVWSMEVKGLSQDKCHASFLVEDISLDAPQLFIYPDDLKELALDFKGKSMECLMPLEGEVDVNPQQAMEYCEGELKTVLMETGEVFSDYQARLYLVNPDCLPGALWESDNTRYESFGLVDRNGVDYCKTVYSFQVADRFSKIEFTHYSGFTDELMEVDFPQSIEPPQEFFNEWCESSELWTETGLGGTAKVLSVEPLLYEGTPACKFEVLVQPISEILPGSTISAYTFQDGRAAALVQTNYFNTFQFTFSPN